MKTIYLFASGSGGHVYPLIGLYKLIQDDYKCIFIGIKSRFEENLYPQNSIFLDIPYSYKNLLKTKTKTKFKNAINYLNELIKDDDLLILGGGFASYIAYKLKHKKIILLEQNRILGDSNLLLGIKAKLILTNMKLKFNPFFYKTRKIISPSIYRNIDKLNIKKTNLIVFIFGSLSSLSLIEKTLKYLSSNLLIDKYNYILYVGKYYDKFKDLKLKNNIKIDSYINDISLLRKAKLVFTRAGGTTINEFLYYNIDFIMIPSPYVKHNHQEKNAKYLNKTYKVPLILEKDYSLFSIYKAIINYQGYSYLKTNNNEKERLKKIIYECI